VVGHVDGEILVAPRANMLDVEVRWVGRPSMLKRYVVRGVEGMVKGMPH
jgi:hypothetical protein